jgi:quinoprotein glucose dehydrogenase
MGLVESPGPDVSDLRFVQGSALTGARRGGGAGAVAGAASSGPAAELSAGSLVIDGIPIIKPPYGSITAIDLDRGEIKWRIAHGETPDEIRNHPSLAGRQIPRTGRAGNFGVLVTKTLIVAGEAGYFTAPNGQRGAMLRAYDKSTGTDAGAIFMPAPQSGTPMTYMLNGRQYIVVAIGGGQYSGEFVAYRLPATVN